MVAIGRAHVVSMTEDVSIKLTREEALVLDGFFARFEETEQLTMKHNAEYITLMRISAQLDKSLVEIFQPDYATKLSKAQQKVATGFEGVAPGVSAQ
jgi:hypothetical protein